MKNFIVFATVFLIGFSTVYTSIAIINRDGDIDTTFGTNGIVETNLGGFNVGEELLIQDDGKIVALGGIYHAETQYMAVRYDSAGSLDTTFGTNGTLEIDGTEGAILPDNNILIAGRSSESSIPSFSLMRYNRDGVLDTTFGTNGIITTSIGSDNYTSRGLDITHNNKIVVMGETDDFYGIMRYHIDGRLDTSLNSTGIITVTKIAPRTSAVYPSGKIIIAGRAGLGYQGMIRYNVDGSLDTTFGDEGFLITDIYSGLDGVADIVIQPDGKIVTAGAGFDFTTQDYQMTVARYMNDGSLDETFATHGMLLINFPVTLDSGQVDRDRTSAIVLQESGEMIITGLGTIDVSGSPRADIVVAKANKNGTLDSSFGTDGFILIEGSGETLDVITQDDAKIVTIGYYGGNFRLIRLLNSDSEHPYSIHIPLVIK